MKTKTFKNAPVYEKLQKLAVAIQSDDCPRFALEQLRALPMFRSLGWRKAFDKLALVLETGEPQFAVFKRDGNSKLPFVAFSSLPAVTCPGAGECLKYCYSFAAWRYPDAFARQAQNAYLMRHNRAAIIAALPVDAVDLRLYVDGDFASVDDVSFWFGTLRANPHLRAYGYSKSFDEILAYRGEWPKNYVLNLSGGHAHDAATVARMRQLPITRGEFVAVNIGRRVKSTEHGTPAINAAIRAKMPGKVFPCPGKCGSCTGAGHACGMGAKLRGVTIAIAVH